MSRLTRQEAVEQVLSGLQALIMMGAAAAASEQYAPTHANPDDMDDAIKAGRESMLAFRRIREEFENLVTGIIL